MRKSEKRRSPRERGNTVAEFYVTDGSLLAGVGRVLDISLTGALVESAVPLESGQRLRIRLRRGDRSDLEIPVTVVRVSRKGATLTYGLKFNR